MPYPTATWAKNTFACARILFAFAAGVYGVIAGKHTGAKGNLCAPNTTSLTSATVGKNTPVA